MSQKSKSLAQNSLDLAFSALVAGPLTVLFWRGTFNSIFFLVFQDCETLFARWLPALILYILGLLVKICLDLVRHTLGPTIQSSGALLSAFAQLLLVYVDSVFGVVLWVGGFNILYALLGLYWWWLCLVFVIACSLLIALKAFHCTGGTPLLLATDDKIVEPRNYFGTSLESHGVLKVVGDTVFTYAIVHTLVICTWWSFWELENRYIFYPCEITMKDIIAWDSVVLSYMLIILIVSINKSVRDMVDETWKTTTRNTVAFLAFLSALNFWRGLWSLQDFYFFPDLNLTQNLALSHILGFLAMYLASISLSLTMGSTRDVSRPQFHDCMYWASGCIADPYADLDENSSLLLGGSASYSQASSSSQSSMKSLHTAPVHNSKQTPVHNKQTPVDVV